MDAPRQIEDPLAYLDDLYHEQFRRARRAQAQLVAAATDAQRAAARATLADAERRKREILNDIARFEDALIEELCEST
jgi:hypothetical protein